MTNIDTYFLNFVANTVQGHFVEKGEPVDLEYIVADIEASPEAIEIVKDFAREVYYGLKKEYKAEKEFQEAIRDRSTQAKIVTYGIIPTGAFLMGCVFTENLLGGYIMGWMAMNIALLKEKQYRSVSAMLSGVKSRREGETYNRFNSMRKALGRLKDITKEYKETTSQSYVQENQQPERKST
ncbi:MAG: hypothetical protein ABIA62_00145 [Candidatus Woesearchaeota archaeon]